MSTSTKAPHPENYRMPDFRRLRSTLHLHITNPSNSRHSTSHYQKQRTLSPESVDSGSLVSPISWGQTFICLSQSKKKWMPNNRIELLTFALLDTSDLY